MVPAEGADDCTGACFDCVVPLPATRDVVEMVVLLEGIMEEETQPVVEEDIEEIEDIPFCETAEETRSALKGRRSEDAGALGMVDIDEQGGG